MSYFKILSGLAFFLLISGVGKAQEIKLPKSQPAFATIIVADIDTSMKWYAKVFGLEKENFTHLPDRGLKQANLSNENLHLELMELNSALSPSDLLEGLPPKSRIRGIFKFGVEVREFAQWIDHLEKCKVKFNGRVVEDENGRQMVVVFDPDGNRIQFFEDQWDAEQQAIKNLIETTYFPVVYNNADPKLLDQACHEAFNMYVNYQGQFYKRSFSEWKTKLRGNLGKDTAENSIAFDAIDITGTTAMVKFRIFADGKLKYTDYLTLYKMEKGWQIFTKMFTIH